MLVLGSVVLLTVCRSVNQDSGVLSGFVAPPKKGHQRNGAVWSCEGGTSCDQRFGDPNRGWVGVDDNPKAAVFGYKISWTQKPTYLERNWFWVDEMRCSMWQLRTCILLLLAERMANLIKNAQTLRNNQLLCVSQIVAVSFSIASCTVVRSPGGNIPFDPTKDFFWTTTTW